MDATASLPGGAAAQLRSLAIDRSSGDARPGSKKLAVAAAGGGAVLVSAVVLAWIALGRVEDAASDQVTSQSVPIAAPATPPPSAGLAGSGYVVARRQATISADVTGRIVETLVEEGAAVEAGQVLARLDPVTADYDLSQATARAQAAEERRAGLEIEVSDARLALSRTQRLAERGFVSPARLASDQARLAALEAQGRAAAAEARAAGAQAARQRDLVARHVVRAPFSGVIVGKFAQEGEIVSPISAGGGFTRTGIYTLVDMISLEIEVDVNESQIQRVREGQPVEAVLEAYPDVIIPAHVAAIVPTANRDRASIRVRIALDQRDPRILPDMAARVTFLGPQGAAGATMGEHGASTEGEQQ